MPLPNKSPTIEGQTELYCQMCSVGKIRNPNQIAIVDYTAIRTLQQVTGKEQRRLKTALLRILRSANGIGAFALTARRTYHNGTSDHTWVLEITHTILDSDVRSSLFPASGLKGRKPLLRDVIGEPRRCDQDSHFKSH
jgi:hypothetical protein